MYYFLNKQYLFFFSFSSNLFALTGGPHSQFPAGWNATTAGLVKLGFAVLMGERAPCFSDIHTHTHNKNSNTEKLNYFATVLVSSLLYSS